MLYNTEHSRPANCPQTSCICITHFNTAVSSTLFHRNSQFTTLQEFILTNCTQQTGPNFQKSPDNLGTNLGTFLNVLSYKNADFRNFLRNKLGKKLQLTYEKLTRNLSSSYKDLKIAGSLENWAPWINSSRVNNSDTSSDLTMKITLRQRLSGKYYRRSRTNHLPVNPPPRALCSLPTNQNPPRHCSPAHIRRKTPEKPTLWARTDF